ncbi:MULTISPECIES: peptidylprolyl isomerase [unclassified Novosphingobium]|uniref:peptidylprolyl isomerase n=1 Tax=unclassified Novosphingobium TaxID=2644732 RepID=UPI000ED8CF4A|nr:MULTISPECIES: peptidylprolyl isomerase [unclassified Novosphingobium]HCF24694.1 peptidylprolyl isomerase [Novosphingobium sp.]HQV04893.1 peptidylprolyl isomerase [Novosphingobium sp.]
MKRRFVLAALPAMLLALTGAAKPKKGAAKPAPAPAPPPLSDVVRIEIVTELGTITADLFHKQAPITVKNIVRYVDSRRYDGVTFYRAMKLEWGTQPNGLIQTGIRDATKLFPPIAHEPTNVTGIKHKTGTLSLARNAPGTARADFSILMSDLSGYDAVPDSPDPEARAGYCAFGQVVSGMDVARKIFDAPRSATLGEGVMKGQMLSPPVKVLRVRRVPIGPA